MIVIGITGPTGAGKTTVLNVLRELGGAVVDCDAGYHELLRSEGPMRDELRARFGAEIFDENGDLRRKELGAIVFGDAGALADLDAITHRHIIEEVERRAAQARAEGRPAVALDAIALLESGLGERCDVTVAVTAPEDIRVGRIMAREGIPEEYARSRVNAQKPDSWFEERCGYPLRNDGEQGALEAGARALFRRIILENPGGGRPPVQG